MCCFRLKMAQCCAWHSRVCGSFVLYTVQSWLGLSIAMTAPDPEWIRRIQSQCRLVGRVKRG
jgi:hypothetical protein